MRWRWFWRDGLAALILFALGAAEAGAQGIAVLKLGWTYTIGFPEGVNETVNPVSGLTPGVQTYRVLGYGGDQWYRLQRVYRHPNGGWYSPRGTPDVWVNIGYALWVHEVVR